MCQLENNYVNCELSPLITYVKYIDFFIKQSFLKVCYDVLMNLYANIRNLMNIYEY